jgi:hypothetical protein
MGRRGLGPPEEVNRRHGPVLAIRLHAVAEARRLPMRDIVPADHVHGRGVHPGEPSHLEDHAARPGHPVHHPLAGRDLALGERLRLGARSPEPTQPRVVRLTSRPRHIIARGVRRIGKRLLELVAEDGVVDRFVPVSITPRERSDAIGVAGGRLGLRRLAPPAMGIRILRVEHREASSWTLTPQIREVSRPSGGGNSVILCTIILMSRNLCAFACPHDLHSVWSGVSWVNPYGRTLESREHSPSLPCTHML